MCQHISQGVQNSIWFKMLLAKEFLNGVKKILSRGFGSNIFLPEIFFFLAPPIFANGSKNSHSSYFELQKLFKIVISGQF